MLSASGLAVCVIFSNPIGYVVDVVSFPLFLYALFTGNDEETEQKPRYQIYNEPIDDGHITWVCPDCNTSNWAENDSCI
jgi:hypothetical protein